MWPWREPVAERVEQWLGWRLRPRSLASGRTQPTGGGRLHPESSGAFTTEALRHGETLRVFSKPEFLTQRRRVTQRFACVEWVNTATSECAGIKLSARLGLSGHLRRNLPETASTENRIPSFEDTISSSSVPPRLRGDIRLLACVRSSRWAPTRIVPSTAANGPPGRWRPSLRPSG